MGLDRDREAGRDLKRLLDKPGPDAAIELKKQAIEPFHAARQRDGQCAVALVLPGAPHREAGEPWTCAVDAVCRPKTGHAARYKRFLRDRRSEMRHTGGMKRQTTIPDSKRLGCMPWAGANGFFARPG